MRPWRFAKHTVQQAQVPEGPQIRSLSQLRHRQRSAQRLTRCCGVMSFGGVLEPAQEERKARGKSVPIGPNAAEKATHELTHMFPKLVQQLRASQSRRRSTSQTTIHCWFTQDALGKELFTILGVIDIAFESPWRKRGLQPVWSRWWSTICEPGNGRSDLPHRRRAGAPCTGRAKSEETVIEGRSKYSSPSMAIVEIMNEELCVLVRCFRIYLREKAKMEITTESPLLPWLVRHCGWILSRYAVRADGRTGYSKTPGT